MLKRLFVILLVLVALVPLSAGGAGKIRVVATIPDLADMARQVGGDLVEVKSLATGVEDIHAVQMKPSFALLLNRSDILLLMGLEAEHSFLPGLLDAARNPRILRDAPGYIDCSVSVPVLEVPTRIDRALGDQHPMGNPHINTDPVRGKAMVRAVADGLSRNYPEHAATLRKNAAAYTAKLDEAIARWMREAAPLKGKRVVSYHPDMIYFFERFGMEAFGTIESRPGINPSPSHVADLKERMMKERVEIVVRERHYPAGLAEAIARDTGAKLVELPVMTGGVPEAKDYISFIDYNVRTMLKVVTGG